MRRLKYLDALLVGSSLIFLAGCGESRKEGLAPVTGQITYGGQPVPAGQVLFYPADGKRRSSGAINQGKYELTSKNPGDGALIGKHKVVIEGTETPPVLPDVDAPGAVPPTPKPPKRVL